MLRGWKGAEWSSLHVVGRNNCSKCLRAEVAAQDPRENPWCKECDVLAGWEREREKEKREGGGVCVGGVGDIRGMLSFSRNRSSQRDSEQGAIANALGQRMLTSTLDFDSCYVSLICGDAGTCCLSQNNKLRKKSRESSEELVTVCIQYSDYALSLTWWTFPPLDWWI